MLQWLVEADFTQDFDLKKVGEHPFQLSRLEQDLRGEAFLKLIKVAYYKIGLVYKRQEVYQQELLDRVDKTK